MQPARYVSAQIFDGRRSEVANLVEHPVIEFITDTFDLLPQVREVGNHPASRIGHSTDCNFRVISVPMNSSAGVRGHGPLEGMSGFKHKTLTQVVHRPPNLSVSLTKSLVPSLSKLPSFALR